MCNEIWWMIITQIKVLCNNSHVFYKMALKTDFHKYFQCSLVDDKNTKLSFIIYAINLKTCFCTVETETTLFGEPSWWNIKIQSIRIQCQLPWWLQPPIATGVGTAANEDKCNTHRFKTQFKYLFKNKVFHTHKEIFKRKIITSFAVHTGK